MTKTTPKKDDETILRVDSWGVLLNKMGWNTDRWKYFGDYKVDKRITQTAMLLVFGFLLLIAWQYDWKFTLFYFDCKSADVEGCQNPFYQPPTWVNQEYLPIGHYGIEPNWMLTWAWPISLGIIIISLIINHIIYNRRSKSWKGLVDGGMK